MKKITSLLLTLAMLATVFVAMPAYASSEVWGDAEVATAFAGGTGTADDPYLISNAAQLRYMNDLVNSGASYTDGTNPKYYYQAAYKLTADIDFENGEWIPLGQALPISYDITQSAGNRVTRENAFEGIFDGDNHVISNVKITRTSDESNTVPHGESLGFFGYCRSAKISNLGLDGIDIQYYNYDYIYDTYEDSTGATKNATERANYIGGFAGSIWCTNISNCYAVNSNVMNRNSGTNDQAHAGFVGALSTNNTISNCYVYNITLRGGLTSYQSGFVGTCTSNGNNLSNCYAAEIKHGEGSLHPTTYGFGSLRNDLVGISSITNCYSTLGDAQGAGTVKGARGKAYNKAQSLGETSMTAEALVEAMLATGAYEVKANVNGGYPYLKSGFDGTPAQRFEYGSGSEDDPYLISTPGELLLASRQVNAGNAKDSYFKLANDIDYCNQPWEPIGYSNEDGSYDFRGGFDGDGHVIRNLTLGTDNYYYCGFFGLLSGATIKNLGIEKFQLIRKNTVTSQIRVVGGFVGAARANSTTEKGTTITNCYIKNSSVQQTTNFGSGSVAAGTRVNIESSLGGFIGRVDIRSYPVELTNCYADNIILDAAVQSRACGFIGGVDFYNNDAATSVKLTNCYASRISNADTKGTQLGFGFISANTTSVVYEFDEEKIVLSNCYSTFSSDEGTNGQAKVIENNYGTENASVDAIANAIEGLEGWQNGDLINAGFPALSWEKAPTAPDYMIKSVANEVKLQTIVDNVCTLSTDNEITVNIRRTPNVAGTAKVYVAGYDIDDRLTGAQSATVNLDDFSFTADIDAEKAATIKVFLWDENQSPIVDPYMANTTEYDQFNEIWAPEGADVVLPQRKTRLVMMGDSIMDSTNNSCDYDWRKWGWEGEIGDYLTDNMTIVKHGHNGQTIKMFMDGRSYNHVCDWESIKTQFGSGDYVILALGSNDNTAIKNGTYTVDQFKEWYRKVISETKAKGATIILLTPKVAASTYNSTTGEFNPDLQAPIARQATIEVANETNTPYIDMSTIYADALNTMIESKESTYEQMIVQKTGSTVTGPGLIYVDGTHLTEFGAKLFAKLFAEKIETMTTGLEEFIVLPTE